MKKSTSASTSSTKKSTSAPNTTLCGYVAIVGRPNVGKSTLLNNIIGKKISITSRKPQTTRHKILGIKTVDNTQTIYVDTPGLHQIKKNNDRAINRYMNKTVYRTLKEVEVVIFMVEGTVWRNEDEWILQKVRQMQCPVILAINKIDEVNPKEILLPYLEEMSKKMNFAAIVPIAARRGTNVAKLEQAISKLLPASPFLYLPEQISDRPEAFRVTEIIREKLMKALGQELPYAVTVELEKFAIQKGVLHVSAVVFVEREGQKVIVIGKCGEKLKHIGTVARIELEKMLRKKIFLQLWVKVKEGWTNNEKTLKKLGYF